MTRHASRSEHVMGCCLPRQPRTARAGPCGSRATAAACHRARRWRAAGHAPGTAGCPSAAACAPPSLGAPPTLGAQPTLRAPGAAILGSRQGCCPGLRQALWAQAPVLQTHRALLVRSRRCSPAMGWWPHARGGCPQVPCDVMASGSWSMMAICGNSHAGTCAVHRVQHAQCALQEEEE